MDMLKLYGAHSWHPCFPTLPGICSSGVGVSDTDRGFVTRAHMGFCRASEYPWNSSCSGVHAERGTCRRADGWASADTAEAEKGPISPMGTFPHPGIAPRSLPPPELSLSLQGPMPWLLHVAGAHVRTGRGESGWNYAPSPSCIKHGMATEGRQGLGSCPPHPPGGLGLGRGLPRVCPVGNGPSRVAPGTGSPSSHGPVLVPALGADAALATRGQATAVLQ